MNPIVSCHEPLRLTPLKDFCLVTATGEDAVTFLHGQLTNDVVSLDPGTARFAGYCTPKGRLLATTLVWKGLHDVVFLLMPRDIADNIVKRLTMFALRARVKITVSDYAVWGMQSEQDTTVMGSLTQDFTWKVQAQDTAFFIQAPGQNRWWCCAPASVQIESVIQKSLPSLMPSEWYSADIQSGMPWIYQATQDHFIPQTVNLDRIGGVSFTKGCYPGQEVVARAHYRGTVKRRMAYACLTVSDDTFTALSAPQTHSTDNVTPSDNDLNLNWLLMDIFHTHDLQTPCGRVINACLNQNPVSGQCMTQLHALIEIQTADLEHEGYFMLANSHGPALQVQAF